MSYILEALKKAEQQRELGRVPGIDSDHDATSATPRRRWLWVLLLAVNAAVLVILFWSWREIEPRVESAPMTVAPETAPAPAMPEPVAEQPLAAQPHVLTQPVEQERQEPARRADAAAPAGAASTGPRPVSRPAPVVRSPALPVWPQIPSHIFEQLNSSLRLDVHVYSDQPRDRFVLVNLRKYHEGDELREGPALEEITREGVILSFRGERFRLQRQ